jgi:hypothetical protein
LFLPATWLKEGINRVVALDLERGYNFWDEFAIQSVSGEEGEKGELSPSNEQGNQ